MSEQEDGTYEHEGVKLNLDALKDMDGEAWTLYELAAVLADEYTACVTWSPGAGFSFMFYIVPCWGDNRPKMVESENMLWVIRPGMIHSKTVYVLLDGRETHLLGTGDEVPILRWFFSQLGKRIEEIRKRESEPFKFDSLLLPDFEDTAANSDDLFLLDDAPDPLEDYYPQDPRGLTL